MAARIVIKGKKVAEKVSGAAPAKKRPKRVHPDREKQFRLLWEHLAPRCVTDKEFLATLQPRTQFLFHPDRKWAFDFAWPDVKVAVEIEGGIFQRGRSGHSSIAGIKRDMEKSNEAQLRGWCVLRFHAEDLDRRATNVVSDVLIALSNRTAVNVRRAINAE